MAGSSEDMNMSEKCYNSNMETDCSMAKDKLLDIMGHLKQVLEEKNNNTLDFSSVTRNTEQMLKKFVKLYRQEKLELEKKKTTLDLLAEIMEVWTDMIQEREKMLLTITNLEMEIEGLKQINQRAPNIRLGSPRKAVRSARSPLITQAVERLMRKKL